MNAPAADDAGALPARGLLYIEYDFMIYNLRVLIRHRPETQTLYAQLYELAAAHELDLVGGFATGLPIEREVRGRTYLYWQLRDVGGRLLQIYLGPADDTRARELRDALAAYKGRRGPIVEDLERLTAAYIASGGPRHLGQHFRVVDALARAGLFRAGVLLVGSHAFVSIGAALGVLVGRGRRDRRHRPVSGRVRDRRMRRAGIARCAGHSAQPRSVLLPRPRA